MPKASPRFAAWAALKWRRVGRAAKVPENPARALHVKQGESAR
jgi:hypothetical protein